VRARRMNPNSRMDQTMLSIALARETVMATIGAGEIVDSGR
jgi:hypothetical protein